MADQTTQTTWQHIPVNIYRTASRLTVAAPMPGIEPEDISVEITPAGKLVIQSQWRGDLKGLKDELVQEWRPGGYYRELDLSEMVDGELANVTYGNGVLVVVLPVAQQTRPARLTLGALGPTRGELARSAGHPIRPHTIQRNWMILSAQQMDQSSAQELPS
jgi:HSP20 family protein